MAELNPAAVPLSLYIHMPWCVRKCPYCDFNSHAVPDGQLSLELEQEYLRALVEDFKTQVDFAQGRQIHSVFIGGGTPSLISAPGYQWLFGQLKAIIPFAEGCEITLEANPAQSNMIRLPVICRPELTVCRLGYRVLIPSISSVWDGFTAMKMRFLPLG